MSNHQPPDLPQAPKTVQSDGNPMASSSPNPPQKPLLTRLFGWLLGLFVLMAVILSGVLYAMTTEQGTKFVLDRVLRQLGVSLTYTKGTLYHGVWVSDVSLVVDSLTIKANQAQVQLGWRAILLGQVHLVNTHIDRLDILDSNAPTDEPFDYMDIATPVPLYAHHVSVKTINYQQATATPINLYDLHIRKANWQGTKVVADGAKINYAQQVLVENVTGTIDLSGDYPLNAQADVSIGAIKDVYFDTLYANVGGSLKRSVGRIKSQYNGHPIHGDFVAQGLSPHTPFSAELYFDKVVLPYAKEQNITLTDGVINADGVIDEIELRLNSTMVGKDIPHGRYQGRGVVTHDGMTISRLTAKTASGQLTAKGSMSWKEAYELEATIDGKGYRVRDILPAEYKEYQAYLPKELTGSLGVRYFYLDKKDNQTRWEFDLNQHSGEKIAINLAQSQAKANAPWHIHATWQNLHRDNVPNLDTIDSKHGSAHVRLDEGRTYIEAKGDITKLSVAPAGTYDVRAMVANNNTRIHLDGFDYQGDIGDLTGQGVIDLATKSQPLSWQFDLSTKKLLPNAYLPNATPFSQVSGSLSASGTMTDDTKNKGVMVHKIALRQGDLTAILSDTLDGANQTDKTSKSDKTNQPNRASKTDKQQVRLIGKGDAKVAIKASTLVSFEGGFDGDIHQTILPQLPKATLSTKLNGNSKGAQIDKLTVFHEFGKASLAGKVQWDKGIGWDIKARLDEINTAKFTNKNTALIAKITGDLSSSGRYQEGKLHGVKATFDGQVLNDTLPQGQLGVDLALDGTRLNINHIRHKGQAGELFAKGVADYERLTWDLTAQMKDFNAGVFVKGVDSMLSGGLGTRGDWGSATKLFAVDGLDLTGRLIGQPVVARGSLLARVALPKDLRAYFDSLKRATQVPKTADELIKLQRRLEANSRQTQQIIKTLTADNLSVRMGSNLVQMNGSEQNLTAMIDISELSELIREARGTIQGGLILVNDKNALPTIYVDLTAKEVRTADINIERAVALGKVVNLGYSPSQLLLEVDNVIMMEKVIKAIRLNVQGTQHNHTISLATNNDSIQANMAVAGSYDPTKNRYQGVLSDGQLQSRFGRLSQRQPTQFVYDVDKSNLQLASHCWQTSHHQGQSGSVCLQETMDFSPKTGKVNVVVQNLDTGILLPVLPDSMVWQSTLNGKVFAQWQQHKAPTINAVLYSDNGRIGVNQDDTGYVEMPYERVSVIAQSVPTGLKIRTDIAGSAGRGYADVVIDPYKKNKPIAGAVAINDINLAVIRPFFPNIQVLTGTVNVAGGIGGYLSKPLFYGNAKLADGQVAVVGVPLHLSDVQATLTVQGTSATLDGDFRSGEGNGVLSGQIDWRNRLQAKLGISGDDLSINQPPLITAKFSPDIEIIVRPSQKYVDVKGVILVPWAVIRPPETSSERIVNESGDVLVLDRRLTGNVAKILAVSAPWSINADIGLDLGDDVVFRGFGAKLPLAGTLHLTQSGQDKMKARGVIQLAERTKVDGIGQNIELNYAQVRFNGDMFNPRLSIEGEKEIEGQTVGVRIKGTAGSPEITVFNDAGLTEQQAMNALVTGRIDESGDLQTSQQAFRSQVTNSLAAAGLSLGLSGTRSLTNQIGNALGLESLTVDASGNPSDTNVNITGYISPDLYIRYGVGVFNAQTTLSMRYQLTRRVYIEATRATESVIDMIYQWKF